MIRKDMVLRIIKDSRYVRSKVNALHPNLQEPKPSKVRLNSDRAVYCKIAHETKKDRNVTSTQLLFLHNTPALITGVYLLS